jgi:hypothetical protein
LNTASWRNFTRQPGGIVTILLLVLLLAFRVQACPMLTDADSASLSTHDCCHDTVTKPDNPPALPFVPCHDGPCLQALGDHGVFDEYLSSASQPDGPMVDLVAEWRPPDWSGRGYFPPPFITVIGPPHSQRSRILRL